MPMYKITGNWAITNGGSFQTTNNKFVFVISGNLQVTVLPIDKIYIK